MNKALLVGVFVILTNCFLGAQKPAYTFVPASLSEITFNVKDCQHFDGTGVGCTQAILRFKEMHIGVVKTGALDVEFLNPDGLWTTIVRFDPSKCRPYVVAQGETDRFVCAGVSWRIRE